MPMYNLTNVNKIMVGSQEYSKAYLGSELIWEGIKLAGQTDKNYLLNSNVIKNFQTVTYDLSHQVMSGTTYTFSMAGWHGGSDWDSNFGIYGLIGSTEILLGEAVNITGSNIYTVTFSDPDITYTKVRVKSMKTSNNWNYQVNWAVLVEGTETHTEYLEPEEIIETIRETTTKPIPFTTTYYDDPNRDAGTYTTTTPGVNGVRTIVWDVIYKNDIENGRVKISDSVTTQPITRRIARGTKPVGITLISGNVYGPVTVSNSQGTFENCYYVDFEATVANATYRATFTRSGTGLIQWSVGSSARYISTWRTSPWDITDSVDYNRLYVQNATDIKVYKL